MITSTYALSQTMLLSSGYNFNDALIVLIQFVCGVVLFWLWLMTFAVWLPLRRDRS